MNKNRILERGKYELKCGLCNVNDVLLGLHVYMCVGMGWKITMLVLSSLALVLGTVILILNVYSNR